MTVTPASKPSFTTSLLTLIRQQTQFYRPLPLGAFPKLTLAPDSTHKYEGGKRGGNFEVQPAFLNSAGGLIFRNTEGEYFGIFVDAEASTLLIERLHEHEKSDELILRSNPDKTPFTVSLTKAAVTRYPVGKQLRLVLAFQKGKPAIHFYNKSPEPMDVALFRANADAALAAEYEKKRASEPTAAASHGIGLWHAARIVAVRFNSTVIFTGVALALFLAAFVVQFAYVREFRRQVRGEPYAVDLDRQHLNVQFNDQTASHALHSQAISYPIYQALTFAGRRQSSNVQSITASDIASVDPKSPAYDVRVNMDGGESRTFHVQPDDASTLHALQDYIFGGDFERAQSDAVAVPSILTTFLLVTFLASGLFLVWGIWQLWGKVREINAGERVLEDARTHKIIGSLDADAQRNIGEKLGPDGAVQHVLQEVDDFGAAKAKREEQEQEKRNARRSN